MCGMYMYITIGYYIGIHDSFLIAHSVPFLSGWFTAYEMTSHDITALRFWGKGGGIPSWNLYFPTLHPGWGEIASWRIKAALVMESCTMYTRLGLALQGYHSPFKVTHSAHKNVLPHEANPKIPSCCPQTVCLHQTASGIQADLFAFEKKTYNLTCGKPPDIFNNRSFWTTRWWLLKLPIPRSICSILSLEIW